MTHTRVEIEIEDLDAMIRAADAGKHGSQESINYMMLSSLPERDSAEFEELRETANVEIPVPHLDVVLVRSSAIQNVSCPNCVWRNHHCLITVSDGKEREMPCDDTFGDRRVFHAFRIIPITVTKNGKKEYVPDTPASFDISGTWGSIKTMIGM